jgi:hypothetical protein
MLDGVEYCELLLSQRLSRKRLSATESADLGAVLAARLFEFTLHNSFGMTSDNMELPSIYT